MAHIRISNSRLGRGSFLSVFMSEVGGHRSVGILTRGIDLHENPKLLCLGILGNEVCSTLFKGVCLFGCVDGFNGPEVGNIFGQLFAFVGLKGANKVPFDFAGQDGCFFQELCELSLDVSVGRRGILWCIWRK